MGGPQKSGNERWHVSAIHKHMLRFHKEDQDASDIEIEVTPRDSTEPNEETNQRDSTESIENFFGFETQPEPPVNNIRESVRPQSLKRPIASPLFQAKRTRTRK